MGLLYGLLIFVFMAAAFFGTAGAPMRERDVQRVTFREQLTTAIANKPFMALLAVKFVQLFGLFTSTAMIFFLVKFVLGKDRPGDWMVMFLVVSTIAQRTLATVEGCRIASSIPMRCFTTAAVRRQPGT